MFSNRYKFHRRIASTFIACAFMVMTIMPPGISYAQIFPQTILQLPAPGTMIKPTSGYVPVLLKGIRIQPSDPLKFDFMIDSGHTDMNEEELKNESTKLIKYFLASVTVPEEDMWVNLSPYEKDRIIPEKFGQTEMGRDLLAQDYILKQLTASLIYPEDELGAKFWKHVYAKAKRLYGTTDIPFDTFNKVWVVPEKAKVYENGDLAYVVEARLRVMLEEDYEAERLSTGDQSPIASDQNLATGHQSLATNIVRDLIVPELEREVNEGKHFAQLRQIYHSMILATWYKRNLKTSILNQQYVGANKIKGIETEDKHIKEKIYQQYLDAFKVGAFNYIKEDYDPETDEVIPRKYFSGGMKFGEVSSSVFNSIPKSLTNIRDVISNKIGTIYELLGRFDLETQMSIKSISDLVDPFPHSYTSSPLLTTQQIKAINNYLAEQGNDLDDIAAVVRILKDYAGEDKELLLEPGAGTGKGALEIAKRFPQMGVIAFDSYGSSQELDPESAADLELWESLFKGRLFPPQEESQENLILVRTDIKEFLKLLPSEYVDYILMINPNSIGNNKNDTINNDVSQEAERILKEEGEFIVFPHRSDLINMSLQKRIRFDYESKNPTFPEELNLTQLSYQNTQTDHFLGIPIQDLTTASSESIFYSWRKPNSPNSENKQIDFIRNAKEIDLYLSGFDEKEIEYIMAIDNRESLESLDALKAHVWHQFKDTSSMLLTNIKNRLIWGDLLIADTQQLSKAFELFKETIKQAQEIEKAQEQISQWGHIAQYSSFKEFRRIRAGLNGWDSQQVIFLNNSYRPYNKFKPNGVFMRKMIGHQGKLRSLAPIEQIFQFQDLQFYGLAAKGWAPFAKVIYKEVGKVHNTKHTPEISPIDAVDGLQVTSVSSLNEMPDQMDIPTTTRPGRQTNLDQYFMNDVRSWNLARQIPLSRFVEVGLGKTKENEVPTPFEGFERLKELEAEDAIPHAFSLVAVDINEEVVRTAEAQRQNRLDQDPSLSKMEIIQGELSRLPEIFGHESKDVIKVRNVLLHHIKSTEGLETGERFIYTSSLNEQDIFRKAIAKTLVVGGIFEDHNVNQTVYYEKDKSETLIPIKIYFQFDSYIGTNKSFETRELLALNKDLSEGDGTDMNEILNALSMAVEDLIVNFKRDMFERLIALDPNRLERFVKVFNANVSNKIAERTIVHPDGFIEIPIESKMSLPTSSSALTNDERRNTNNNTHLSAERTSSSSSLTTIDHNTLFNFYFGPNFQNTLKSLQKNKLIAVAGDHDQSFRTAPRNIGNDVVNIGFHTKSRPSNFQGYLEHYIKIGARFSNVNFVIIPEGSIRKVNINGEKALIAEKVYSIGKYGEPKKLPVSNVPLHYIINYEGGIDLTNTLSEINVPQAGHPWDYEYMETKDIVSLILQRAGIRIPAFGSIIINEEDEPVHFIKMRKKIHSQLRLDPEMAIFEIAKRSESFIRAFMGKTGSGLVVLKPNIAEQSRGVIYMNRRNIKSFNLARALIRNVENYTIQQRIISPKLHVDGQNWNWFVRAYLEEKMEKCG